MNYSSDFILQKNSWEPAGGKARMLPIVLCAPLLTFNFIHCLSFARTELGVSTPAGSRSTSNTSRPSTPSLDWPDRPSSTTEKPTSWKLFTKMRSFGGFATELSLEVICFSFKGLQLYNCHSNNCQSYNKSIVFAQADFKLSMSH